MRFPTHGYGETSASEETPARKRCTDIFLKCSSWCPRRALTRPCRASAARKLIVSTVPVRH